MSYEKSSPVEGKNTTERLEDYLYHLRQPGVILRKRIAFLERFLHDCGEALNPEHPGRFFIIRVGNTEAELAQPGGFIDYYHSGDPEGDSTILKIIEQLTERYPLHRVEEISDHEVEEWVTRDTEELERLRVQLATENPPVV